MIKRITGLFTIVLLVALSFHVANVPKEASGISGGLTGTLAAQLFVGYDPSDLQKYADQGVKWVIIYEALPSGSTLPLTVHNLGMKLLVYVTSLQEGSDYTPPSDSWLQFDGTNYVKLSTYGFYGLAPYGPYVDNVLVPRVQDAITKGADGVFLDALLLRPNCDKNPTYGYPAVHPEYTSFQWWRLNATHYVAKKAYDALKAVSSSAVLMISNNNIFTESDKNNFASYISRWQDVADGFVLEVVGNSPDPYLSDSTAATPEQAVGLLNNEKNPPYSVTKPIWLLYSTNREDNYQYLISQAETQSFGFWQWNTKFIVGRGNSWFTWYDTASTNGLHNIHFLNLGSASAHITISIPDWQQVGHPAVTYSFTLPAGQASYWNSKDFPPHRPLIGGPIHITSDQAVWVTERITGWGSFKEIPGVPEYVAAKDIYYTWYDLASGASLDDIHVVNPSSSRTANVRITIPDSRPGHSGVDTSFTVAPGQDVFQRFPNLIGGPVHIASNIPVISTQRVTGWGDFDEIIGLPSWYAYSDNWFNWYDSQGSQDNIHLTNLGAQAATVDIYVGTSHKPTLNIGAGASTFVSYASTKTGPVHIVSSQPVRVSQRITGWNGFNEVYGLPKGLLSVHPLYSWGFTWYDTASGSQTNNIHFTNPSSTTATITVTITDTRPGFPGVHDTFTLGSGLATFKYYPNVIGGPVLISSNKPFLATQRIYGWDSFDEILGVQWLN